MAEIGEARLSRLPSKLSRPRGDKAARTNTATRSKIEESAELEYNSSGVDKLDDLLKLLDSAHELMADDSRLSADAFEHLRRLKVKVRFAKSAGQPNPTAALPTVAPRLWKDRKSDETDPLKFTETVYSQWLHHGISRATIRKLDRPLYDAWYSFKVTDEQLDAIGMPTKAKLNTKLIESAGPLRGPSRAGSALNLSPAESERARLWNVAKRRRERGIGG